MRTLIVQSNRTLSRRWANQLQTQGVEVCRATTGAAAMLLVETDLFDVIVLDLMLSDGSGLPIADFAEFWQPDAQVIIVTNTSFFADGSIFRHVGNARAFLKSDIPPADIAAIAMHYGAVTPDRAARPEMALG